MSFFRFLGTGIITIPVAKRRQDSNPQHYDLKSSALHLVLPLRAKGAVFTTPHFLRNLRMSFTA
jgi:hypothetical protein